MVASSTPTADSYHVVLEETIYHWSVYDPAVKCSLSCTALQVDSGLVVFDPVPLAEPFWQELTAKSPLRAILLTNGNHPRCAEPLRQKSQVPIVCSMGTRRALDGLKPDVILLENELLYGIRSTPLLGATPGETAFFCPNQLLVLGDAVINSDPEHGLQLLPDKYCVDPEQNWSSLRGLLAYDFSILALGHGEPVVNQAREKLATLIASAA